MAIDHSLFVVKKYTTTSKLAAKGSTSFAPASCTPAFEWPVISGIKYEPIGFSTFTRSNTNYALTGINLREDTTAVFRVGNLSTSAMSSNITTSLEVIFAPSYMVNGDVENPVFIKREYTYSPNESLASGATTGYLAGDFDYSIPTGYEPFSLTRFTVTATACSVFNTINTTGFEFEPTAVGDIEEFITINNMASSAKTIDTINLEVVFIRKDMQISRVEDNSITMLIQFDISDELAADLSGKDDWALTAEFGYANEIAPRSIFQLREGRYISVPVDYVSTKYYFRYNKSSDAIFANIANVTYEKIPSDSTADVSVRRSLISSNSNVYQVYCTVSASDTSILANTLFKLHFTIDKEV